MVRLLTIILLLIFIFTTFAACSPSDKQVEEAVKTVMGKEREEKARIFKYIDEYMATKGGRPSGPPGGVPMADNKEPKKVEIGNSPFKGSKNAPVTIVEFSDFQCPFCSRVNPTLNNLMKKYPGKLKIVFKHQPLPSHQNAKIAAQASMAAHKQGKFWEMHDLIFANQDRLNRESLTAHAKKLGLNEGQFKKDLDDPAILKQIEEEGRWAMANGLGGTPSFLINGQVFVGAQPEENFVAMIDKALGK